MTDNNYLILAFPDDSPSFSYGFEAGCVYERIKNLDPDDEFDQMVHAANSELFIRIAELYDREIRADYIDDTWINLKVGRYY